MCVLRSLLVAAEANGGSTRNKGQLRVDEMLLMQENFSREVL